MPSDERMPLAEINRACMRELHAAALALPESTAGPPLLTSLRTSWARLDVAAIERLASAPFAWVDGAFGSLLPGAGIGGVRDGGHPSHGSFFSPAMGRAVMRRLALLGWHLARSRPRMGQLVLGCDASTIEVLARSPLVALETLAEVRGGVLRPRWPQQIEYWRALLDAAANPGTQRLDELMLNGVQRVAGDALVVPRAPSRHTG